MFCHSQENSKAIFHLQSDKVWHAQGSKGFYPGEQSIKAMDFLPFSHIGVILSNPLQGQLLHQVYLIGLLQMGVLFTKAQCKLILSEHLRTQLHTMIIVLGLKMQQTYNKVQINVLLLPSVAENKACHSICTHWVHTKT